MSTLKPIQLGGKYVLLDLIGIGGMAEVYRSKLIGDKGFEKQIVIKKLLPQIAQSKEMVGLFIDEARLAALLQHENIAATYDFGEIDGNYFLAMEHLSGKDLATVMQRAREWKRPLEIKHALQVASRICEGMDYAHSLKDLEGTPLNIIHRDLTPHNIFITYNGKVKIFDFGVAKAEILDNRTKSGVVRGKLSYMSPEQISSDIVDLRSDIFSIGILLYEMLSGRRMYRGDTATLIKKCISVDYEALEKIEPNLPPELYDILHKALARDPESRYQCCADMQADIDDLMFSMAERQDSKSLHNYIKSLFTEEFDSYQKDNISFVEKTVVLDTGYGTIAHPKFSLRRFLDYRKWGDKRIVLICSTCIVFIATLPSTLSYQNDLPVSPPAIKQKVELEAKPLSSQEAIPQVTQQNRTEKEKRREAVVERKREAEKRKKERYREAQKRIQQIGDSYANQVQLALKAGKMIDAEKLVDIGLYESPDHAGLLTLKTNIKEEKSAIIRNNEKFAKLRFSDNEFTEPAGDSAYYYYNEIMKLDPASEIAQEGFKTIADRCAALADIAFRKFELATAEKYVESGLKVMPDHTRLQKIKADLGRGSVTKIFMGVEKNLQVFEKNLGDMLSN